MASAKKRRGRERKAARKKDNNDGARTDCSNGGNGELSSNIISDLRLINEMLTGSNMATSSVIACYQQEVPIEHQPSIISLGLLDIALLNITLDHLGRCNEDFESVMRGIGGDLETPIKWLELLIIIATKSNEYHSRIIDKIGPLVRCMCDDIEREFFGSKRYWHEAISPFIGIIYKMLEAECNNFIQLSQYKGLFEMMVQSWFWQSHRPDIVNEFNTLISTPEIPVSIRSEDFENNDDPSATMTALGMIATLRLIAVARKTDDAKKMLGNIGSIPIVSRAYDPNCKVSLTVGLIRYIKKSGDRAKYFHPLFLLIQYAECVDKDVITEMIDYGFKFASEYEDADVATQLICSMITRMIDGGDAAQLNDSRTAFAIRAGLLDMCIKMIACFGGVKHAHEIVISVFSILQNVYFLLYHKKTSKAIGDKRGNLWREFQKLKENQQLTNNDCTEYNNAMYTIQSIINMTAANCFICNKETERENMKKCAACKSVCYCSKECQRKDWHSGGHGCDCLRYINGTNELSLRSLDGSEREAAKLKGLRRNIMMAQKRLFIEHAETIRERLAVKQSPHSEYIVHFDLFQCPLAVTVMACTEYFVSCHSKKWFDENIQLDDENIMCVYVSPFFNGNSNEPGCPENLIVYTLYPREWLSSEA